jgi:hypothetical protein
MLTWLVVLLVVAGVTAWITWMPGRSHRGPLPPLSSAERESRERLERHVRWLAGAIGERNVWRPDALSAAASYLEAEVRGLGLEPRAQEFSVAERPVRNLEAELRGREQRVVVLGAHYDSVAGSPGANDNASGVAALLEVARALRAEALTLTLRFVFFVNEEPPWFSTEDMGSLHYARRCRERGDSIESMLSIETVGYYADREGSQAYPFPLGLVYPSRGDFVAFVSRMRDRALVTRSLSAFRRGAAFPSQGAAAPAVLPGVGWSDHWSFWRVGVPAMMVTDTAPYRYPAYHVADDTPEELDYERLARVVTGLIAVTRELAGGASRSG